jgi:hypothetical protein
MSVLKPVIDSIVNGTLTITATSASAVSTLFDKIRIFRATGVSGPYSMIVELDVSASVTYCDLSSTPALYYKAQYYNSDTFVSSVFSEPAQETGIFSEYTVPESTATYPPEIALSDDDREIVESIRLTVGDSGLIERDIYEAADPQSNAACAAQIDPAGCTWEMDEWKAWPQKVVLNGIEKTDINDPQVIGYRYLSFSGTGPCITGSLDVYYNHFRFSDREILLAYDRARNLLVSCGLAEDGITTEMRIMQAAILLLEGEIREVSQGAFKIVDGDTTYDNSAMIRSRTEDLSDLKRKIDRLVECARYAASYSITGVRVD